MKHVYRLPTPAGFRSGGAVQGVLTLQHRGSETSFALPVRLGADIIWGAINWPAYWATRPVPFSQATARFPHYPVLGQNGKVDDRVFGLQHALNDVLGIKLKVDGQFGTDTADACKQFQRASRIPVTGVADQQTWACLDIALDKLTK